MKNDQFFYTRRTPQGWLPSEPISLSTKLVLEEAERLGLAWRALPGTKIIELKLDQHFEYFRFQIPSKTSDVGFYTCLDKGVTNSLLGKNGISVPKGFNLNRQDKEAYWDEVFNSLSKPVVVKPTHGNQGNAISLNIRDIHSYHQAIKKAFDFLNDREAGVMVEEQFEGQEYRVLASTEGLIGILYRMPANVVGNGTSTLKELINEKNSDPRRGDDLTYALFIIHIDDDLLSTIADQGFSLESVIPADKQVFLRKVSNIAKGGDSIDVTDIAHPSVMKLAEKVMASLPGLSFAGIDLMTKDITKPQTPDNHVIVEVNSSPGFCIQEMPYLGKPRNAKRIFLELMFPEIKGK